MRYLPALALFVCLSSRSGVREMCGLEDVGDPIDGALQLQWLVWLITIAGVPLGVILLAESLTRRAVLPWALALLGLVAVAWLWPVWAALVVMLGAPALTVVATIWPRDR